jgi:hypothetical protein
MTVHRTIQTHGPNFWASPKSCFLTGFLGGASTSTFGARNIPAIVAAPVDPYFVAVLSAMQ